MIAWSTRAARLLPLSMMVVITMVAGGCGGEGDSASAGATGDQGYNVQANTAMAPALPPIGKAQFVARVNKFCREAWTTVVKNWDQYSGTQNPKLSRKARFSQAVQNSLLAGIDFHIFDSIRILGAPRGDERTVEEIIGPMQAAVELGQLRRWQAYSAAEIAAEFDAYNKPAQRYGLDDCLVNEAHLRPIEKS